MCDDAGHAAILCLGSNLAADVTDRADRIARFSSHANAFSAPTPMP